MEMLPSGKNLPEVDRFRKILLQHWGYPAFRPMQEDIIASVAAGNDTLALLPTGGGKSITFQVPALASDGICIVVTPLIALMKDQVDQLAARGIKAYALHSGHSHNEIKTILDNCIYSPIKFLYIAPERISSPLFIEKLKSFRVNLIAVDEAHCISQWGYDFRPSYLQVARLREYVPQTPVLALTATATPEVAKDIMQKLRFPKEHIISSSFERKNLTYAVKIIDDKQGELVRIIQKSRGCGIIYTRSRQKTKDYATLLTKNGIKADYYHAGLDAVVRSTKQNAWKNNETRVIVATNAFGMGIDKPDVRFVIHVDLPDSPEEYFQEAGRAGRDLKESYALLLLSGAEVAAARQRIDNAFPELPFIRQVYEMLGNYFQVPYGGGKGMAFDFSLIDLARRYKQPAVRVFAALRQLEKDGYIELSDEVNSPPLVHFLMNRDDLYRFQVANQAFDSFIKLLLRSYTGIFTDYTAIDELSLAKRAGSPPETIREYLNKLKSAGVIHYIPRRTTPVLVFTEERLDPKSLFLSHGDYEKRKTRYAKRLQVLIDYCQAQNHCRQSLLLSYFGEEISHRCGKCDICRKRNELNMSKMEFDVILDKIKGLLLHQPLPLKELVHRTESPSDKVIKVVRYLMDGAKISPDGQLLKWTGKV